MGGKGGGVSLRVADQDPRELVSLTEQACCVGAHLADSGYEDHEEVLYTINGTEYRWGTYVP